MPLYEYECESCTHRFERIRKFSDPPLNTCPSCGGAVRKLLSSPAIQFKGTGWYITDYARKAGNDGGASKDAKDSKDSAKKDTAASPAADSGSTSTPAASTTKPD